MPGGASYLAVDEYGGGRQSAQPRAQSACHVRVDGVGSPRDAVDGAAWHACSRRSSRALSCAAMRRSGRRRHTSRLAVDERGRGVGRHSRGHSWRVTSEWTAPARRALRSTALIGARRTCFRRKGGGRVTWHQGSATPNKNKASPCVCVLAPSPAWRYPTFPLVGSRRVNKLWSSREARLVVRRPTSPSSPCSPPADAWCIASSGGHCFSFPTSPRRWRQR